VGVLGVINVSVGLEVELGTGGIVGSGLLVEVLLAITSSV
jgi:hypothetical protein